MGKCIVITGATRGLGRALVHGFQAAGERVYGCGRSAEQITQLNASGNLPNAFRTVDISNMAAVQAWADTLLDWVGPPDLLINNAALMNNPAPLWQVPTEEFDRLIDVNIKGVANVIRAFVPAMIEHGSGVIVNLSSGWGRSTSPEVAPYCASKYAIEGLTLAMAQELPRGFAAVALNPGVINTEMLRQCWGDGAEHFPTPEAWAYRAVPFLRKLSARDNGRSLSVS